MPKRYISEAKHGRFRCYFCGSNIKKGEKYICISYYQATCRCHMKHFSKEFMKELMIDLL